MIIARPTAASAAATVITKNTNNWPIELPKYEEKATSVRLAEFNISSTDIKTIIAFLRIRTPETPTININALKIR
jgi:hypothetical protein